MLYNGTKLSCDKTFYVYQLFSDKTLSSDNMLSCDKHRKNCECCPVSQLIVR